MRARRLVAIGAVVVALALAGACRGDDTGVIESPSTVRSTTPY